MNSNQDMLIANQSMQNSSFGGGDFSRSSVDYQSKSYFKYSLYRMKKLKSITSDLNKEKLLEGALSNPSSPNQQRCGEYQTMYQNSKAKANTNSKQRPFELAQNTPSSKSLLAISPNNLSPVSSGLLSARNFRSKSPMKSASTPNVFPSPNARTPTLFKNGRYPSYLEQIDGVYEGDVDLEYKKEGFGVFLADSGEMYIGEWSNDLMHGEGILHLPFGGSIYGQFRSNRIQGVAILQLPNNSAFIAYWKDSRLHGKCFKLSLQKRMWSVCLYSHGSLSRRIATESIDVLSSGITTPKLMEPHEDLRFWMNRLSKKQYFCERNLSTSSKYLCHLNIERGLDYIGFVECKRIPSGLGLISFEKRIIQGYFKNGVLEGSGRMILDNGDIYDGQFKGGQFSGKGVYYNFENNSFVYAIFDNNKPSEIIDKGPSYPSSIIANMKAGAHRRHRGFQKKESSIEKLAVLSDFSKQIFLGYQELYSNSSKNLQSSPQFTQLQPQQQEQESDEQMFMISGLSPVRLATMTLGGEQGSSIDLADSINAGAFQYPEDMAIAHQNNMKNQLFLDSSEEDLFKQGMKERVFSEEFSNQVLQNIESNPTKSQTNATTNQQLPSIQFQQKPSIQSEQQQAAVTAAGPILWQDSARKKITPENIEESPIRNNSSAIAAVDRSIPVNRTNNSKSRTQKEISQMDISFSPKPMQQITGSQTLAVNNNNNNSESGKLIEEQSAHFPFVQSGTSQLSSLSSPQQKSQSGSAVGSSQSQKQLPSPRISTVNPTATAQNTPTSTTPAAPSTGTTQARSISPVGRSIFRLTSSISKMSQRAKQNIFENNNIDSNRNSRNPSEEPFRIQVSPVVRSASSKNKLGDIFNNKFQTGQRSGVLKSNNSEKTEEGDDGSYPTLEDIEAVEAEKKAESAFWEKKRKNARDENARSSLSKAFSRKNDALNKMDFFDARPSEFSMHKFHNQDSELVIQNSPSIIVDLELPSNSNAITNSKRQQQQIFEQVSRENNMITESQRIAIALENDSLASSIEIKDNNNNMAQKTQLTLPQKEEWLFNPNSKEIIRSQKNPSPVLNCSVNNESLRESRFNLKYKENARSNLQRVLISEAAKHSNTKKEEANDNIENDQVNGGILKEVNDKKNISPVEVTDESLVARIPAENNPSLEKQFSRKPTVSFSKSPTKKNIFMSNQSSERHRQIEGINQHGNEFQLINRENLSPLETESGFKMHGESVVRRSIFTPIHADNRYKLNLSQWTSAGNSVGAPMLSGSSLSRASMHFPLKDSQPIKTSQQQQQSVKLSLNLMDSLNKLRSKSPLNFDSSSPSPMPMSFRDAPNSSMSSFRQQFSNVPANSILDSENNQQIQNLNVPAAAVAGRSSRTISTSSSNSKLQQITKNTRIELNLQTSLSPNRSKNRCQIFQPISTNSVSNGNKFRIFESSKE